MESLIVSSGVVEIFEMTLFRLLAGVLFTILFTILFIDLSMTLFMTLFMTPQYVFDDPPVALS